MYIFYSDIKYLIICIYIYIKAMLLHFRVSTKDSYSSVNYYGYAFTETFQAGENGSNTLNLYAL